MTPTLRLLASGGIVLLFYGGSRRIRIGKYHSFALSHLCKLLWFNTDYKLRVVPLANLLCGLKKNQVFPLSHKSLLLCVFDAL